MTTIQEKLAFVEKYSDLYHAQEERVRDMIYKGSLHSVIEIQNKVFDIYENTSLKEVSADIVYGLDRMLKNSFRSYIIHCEKENIVPTTGYSESV